MRFPLTVSPQHDVMVDLSREALAVWVKVTTNKGLPTWKRDFIIQFINKRYNAMKPTFFTSNNGIEQLSATGCPEAAIDRIREMVVAECLLVGASYRLRKSQELSAEMRELLFGREG